MFGAVNDVSQEVYPLLCASDREGNGRRLCGTGLEATLKLPRDNLDGSRIAAYSNVPDRDCCCLIYFAPWPRGGRRITRSGLRAVAVSGVCVA